MHTNESSAILEKVRSVVAIANRTPSIAQQLRGWERTFLLAIEDERIVIDTSAGFASVDAKLPRAEDVSFAMSERTLDLLIAGRLSPLTAKLTGRLRSSGNLPDILRFASVFTACLRQQRAGSRLSVAHSQAAASRF